VIFKKKEAVRGDSLPNDNYGGQHDEKIPEWAALGDVAVVF
jgi:hypothetical protein